MARPAGRPGRLRRLGRLGRLGLAGIVAMGSAACSAPPKKGRSVGRVGDFVQLTGWRLVVRGVHDPYSPVTRFTVPPTPSVTVPPIAGVTARHVPTLTAAPVQTFPPLTLTPRTGAHFIGVDVDLTNRTSQVEQGGDFEFHLEDGAGHRFGPTTGGTFAFPPGGVDPGTNVRGVVAFEIPNSSTSLTLGFEPGPSSTARVKLTG